MVISDIHPDQSSVVPSSLLLAQVADFANDPLTISQYSIWYQSCAKPLNTLCVTGAVRSHFDHIRGS